MASKIDWDFISSLEGKSNIGYVPDKDGSKSGVTIASGFDLGARKASDLKGLPEDLIAKLTPYLGLKGEDAERVAKDLVVSSDESNIIDSFSKTEATTNLVKRWKEKTGSNFSDLSGEKQTAVASVAFQYGDLASETPNFWRQTTSGDWNGALKNLRNFEDKYPTRRNKEAGRLELGINLEKGIVEGGGAMKRIKDSQQASQMVEGAPGMELKKKSKTSVQPTKKLEEQVSNTIPPELDARKTRVDTLVDAAKPQTDVLPEIAPNTEQTLPEQEITLEPETEPEPEPSISLMEQRVLDEPEIDVPNDFDLVERQTNINEAKNAPEFAKPPQSTNAPTSSEFIRAARPVTAPQRIAAEKAFEEQKQKQKPEINLDLAKKVINQDWVISDTFFNREEFVPDENFQLTAKFASEMTEGLPEEYHEAIIENSYSEAQARSQREAALKQYEFDQEIGSLGWKGVGLRMGAAIADPTAIAISIGTEGIAAPLIFGNKISRIGRILRGATGAAVSNAAIESYLVSQNDFKDPYDILYSMSAGLILGGAVGSLGKGDTSDPFVTALGRMADHADNAQKINAVEHINKEILGEDSPDKLSIGAAVNPDSLPIQVRDLRSDEADFLDSAGEPVEAYLANGRFDMTSFLLSSENRISNYLGRVLGEDAVGFRKEKNQRIDPSADIIKTNTMKSSFANFYKTYDGSYKEWAKESGFGFFKRTFNVPRRQFGELVADAIENPNLPVSSSIRRAANKQAELQTDLLRSLKEAGVEGFEEVPENLSYFTHLWDSYKFTEAATRFREIDVVNLLSRSLLNGTEDLQEEAAQKIASAMVMKLRQSAAGMDAGAGRLFNATDRDVMRKILIEEDYMSEQEADDLLALFSKKPDGKPARAKRRLRFDMNLSVGVVNRQGKQEILRIKDLQERDAEQIFTSYASQMAGRIGLGRVGIKSETQFNKLLDRNLSEAAGREGNAGKSRAEKENLVSQTIFNMIVNRRAPLASDPSGNFARSARLVQDYNFIRLMNQVGFAQVAELGNALAIGGVRGVLQSVPSIRAMLKRAKDGEIEDSVLRDIESSIGVGSDRLTMQAMNKADTIGVFSEGRGDLIDKALFAMQPLKRLTSDISGMAPITLALERIAARCAVQTLTDMAFTSRKISLDRLGGLGLDKDLTEKVLEQIRTNATTKKSTLFRNREIKAINLSEWQDGEARDAFLIAISRWTRRSIQQNDVGNLNLYMTSTMGGILTQFRTFMLVSHAKQFLHNIRANDFKAYSAMMYSSAFAGLAYMAQTQLNSIGRKDREEFLKERLSVESIAKASFQRSSWAALFPAAVDTGAAFFTDDPIFAFRSTGLDTNFITGNPSVQAITKGLGSAQAVSRSIVNPDLQFSQGNQRALNTLVPWNNAIGIKNVMNKVVDMRPESTQVE